MKNKVLIVGYSRGNLGGVTTVTNVLLANMPQLGLHAALRWYGPRWRVLAFFMFSISTFLCRLIFAAPRVVQVIVASRGDAVRMLPYIVLAKLRGCKVCLHFHTNRAAIFDQLPGAIARLALATWKRVDGYCFLSRRLRAEYDGEFEPRKPCFVIPNPISAEWLRQDVLSRPDRTHGLVFLGRWTAEKGIDELLAVMRKLDIGTSIRCDIFSDHRPPMNPDNCDCHGWLAEDAVRQVLREAKLVLLPSHAEAFPMVLLEAAACGTPFVASNVAGVPDIAEQSGAGLLHEVGDVDGMRKAISRLLTDDALWAECSYNGRRWVETLAVSEVVPQWHRFYAEFGVEFEGTPECSRDFCRERTAPFVASAMQELHCHRNEGPVA
jgi:glycosyltransferase involved in cell wall biosynthesis